MNCTLMFGREAGLLWRAHPRGAYHHQWLPRQLMMLGSVGHIGVGTVGHDFYVWAILKQYPYLLRRTLWSVLWRLLLLRDIDNHKLPYSSLTLSRRGACPVLGNYDSLLYNLQERFSLLLLLLKWELFY
jgi:hypothetical protein